MTRLCTFFCHIFLLFFIIESTKAVKHQHINSAHTNNHKTSHDLLRSKTKLHTSHLKPDHHSYDGELNPFGLDLSQPMKDSEHLLMFPVLDEEIHLHKIPQDRRFALQKKAKRNLNRFDAFLSLKQDEDSSSSGDETPATEDVASENQDIAITETTTTTTTTEQTSTTTPDAVITDTSSQDLGISQAQPETSNTYQTTDMYASSSSDDLGDRLDQVSANLQTSVDSIKAELRRTGTQIQQNLETNVHNTMGGLTANIKGSIDNLADMITAEGAQTREGIAQTAYDLNQEIQSVGAKTDANSAETISLKIMLLEDDLEQRQERLDDLNAEIEQLKLKMPDVGIDTCGLYTDCSGCSKDAKCGWCISEHKCVRGDERGPLSATCNFYDYQKCSGSACARLRDCYSCILDPFCGWCQVKANSSEGSCIEQSATYDGCAVNLWFHSQGSKNQCDLPMSPSAMQNITTTPADSSATPEGSDETTGKAATEQQEREARQHLMDLLAQQQILQAEINQIQGQIDELHVRQRELEGLPKLPPPAPLTTVSNTPDAQTTTQTTQSMSSVPIDTSMTGGTVETETSTSEQSSTETVGESGINAEDDQGTNQAMESSETATEETVETVETTEETPEATPESTEEAPANTSDEELEETTDEASETTSSSEDEDEDED